MPSAQLWNADSVVAMTTVSRPLLAKQMSTAVSYLFLRTAISFADL